MLNPSCSMPATAFLLNACSCPQLELQVVNILMLNGSLIVGSQDAPYPGLANITLTGAPGARALPVYGTKVLAIRGGTLSLVGMPKLPAWTLLNATANIGDNSIVIRDEVNWAVGEWMRGAVGRGRAGHWVNAGRGRGGRGGGRGRGGRGGGRGRSTNGWWVDIKVCGGGSLDEGDEAHDSDDDTPYDEFMSHHEL